MLQDRLGKVAAKAVAEWAKEFRENLPPKILKRIGQANFDLYLGPIEEDDWPGFSRALAEIRAALTDMPDKLWVDLAAGVVETTEPCGYHDEETDEWIEPADYTRINRDVLMEAVLGEELRAYF